MNEVEEIKKLGDRLSTSEAEAIMNHFRDKVNARSSKAQPKMPKGITQVKAELINDEFILD